MGAEKMNPRDSIPTTTSTCSAAYGSSIASIAARYGPGSLSSVVMS